MGCFELAALRYSPHYLILTSQAIAALTFGVGGVPVCDAIVGPGNKYVTAAKSLVFTT
jgi:histidinol dehydrogenase